MQALSLEPDNFDYQFGLADHYIKRGLLQQAVPIVQAMVTTHPERPTGMQMMQYLQSALSAPSQQ